MTEYTSLELHFLREEKTIKRKSPEAFHKTLVSLLSRALCSSSGPCTSVGWWFLLVTGSVKANLTFCITYFHPFQQVNLDYLICVMCHSRDMQGRQGTQVKIYQTLEPSYK
jgi:hypothetical protein